MQLLQLSRPYLHTVTCISLIFLAVACSDSRSTSPEAKLAFDRVIPKPISADASGKAFIITENTSIVVEVQKGAGLQITSLKISELLQAFLWM